MDGITVNTPFGKREQVHSTERRDKNLGVTAAGHHRGVTTAGPQLKLPASSSSVDILP